jgi:hypothetical protein
MRKFYPFIPFLFFIFNHLGKSQTVDLATEHMDRLDKMADAASEAFFEYANVRLLDEKEKAINRKKGQLLDALESQERRIANEKPFNGQLKLKTAYTLFIQKLRQFPENLGTYSEISFADYRNGLAQKRKKEFLAQLEILKNAAGDLNQEVSKYIIINKLKDFRKGSAMPEKWNKAFLLLSYGQKMQEAVFTIGSLDRYFYDLIGKDSIEKAEKVRIEILQLSASLGGAVKMKPAAPTDFSLREAAVNSINLFRMDAFRNYKSMVNLKKKEAVFLKKNPQQAVNLPKKDNQKSKIEMEKAQLETELTDMRNLAKEMKMDRDRHESAFEESMSQYLNDHAWN